MLKTDSLIFKEILNISHQNKFCGAVWRKYGNSKKSKIVCSVKLSRLEFVSLPITDQLQPNFYKLSCVEQWITKLDGKSNMYRVVKCP